MVAVACEGYEPADIRLLTCGCRFTAGCRQGVRLRGCRRAGFGGGLNVFFGKGLVLSI